MSFIHCFDVGVHYLLIGADCIMGCGCYLRAFGMARLFIIWAYIVHDYQKYLG